MSTFRLLFVFSIACGSHDTSTPGGDDDPVDPSDPPVRAARVGVYAAQNSFFQLDVDGAPLRFHFGENVSRWNAVAVPFAGDFDGDGYDTIATAETDSGRIRIADDNDSDERRPRGAVVSIDFPPTPLQKLPVAGDWDGDGRDGIGLYAVNTRTFYLRQTADSGPPDLVVTVPTDVPPGRPLAGDWDGDGADEVGVYDGAKVYLDVGGTRRVIEAPGIRVVSGDFDADGTDTIATFDRTTNELAIRDEEGNVTNQRFGYLDPMYWTWEPIAGAWHVPTVREASNGYEWPTGSPADHGMNAASISAALSDAASIENIESVLVARNGVLVAERYYHGYDRDIAGNIKSVSKSVMSALVGIAIEDGLIGSLDDTAASYLPDYFANLSAEKKTIRLEDMLTMRGGLDWDQDVDLPKMINSDDHLAYGLALPMIHPPGTTYLYCQVMTQLGTGILARVTGKPVHAYARERLLERIGITIPRWDLAPEGFEVGGAEMWMRPRDLARFGELYLRGGTLDGVQVLTPQWAQRSANPWVPELQGRRYGLWWRERPWTNYAFGDSYFGWGYGGQFVFVFPRHDLVVVVMSKWNVSGQQAEDSANAIFAFVDNRILRAVQPQ